MSAGSRELDFRLGDGTRLNLIESGDGEPMVLIPGWACSLDVFALNVPAFAQQYRVIAYDPRSQGRSEQVALGNNYVRRGRDLAELIEALSLDRAVLLGWSLGVFDVLSYVELFGFDRIRALVLVDESPAIIKTADDDWGEGRVEEIDGLIASVNGPGYLPFFREYMAAGFEGDAPEELLDRMTAAAAAVPAQRAAALLKDATQYDFTAVMRLASERVPVMQVLRKEWSEPATRWIRANQPTARVEVLGGHLMLVEYPEAFNRAVLSFLAGG